MLTPTSPIAVEDTPVTTTTARRPPVPSPSPSRRCVVAEQVGEAGVPERPSAKASKSWSSSLQIRLTSDFDIPEGAPRAWTRSSTSSSRPRARRPPSRRRRAPLVDARRRSKSRGSSCPAGARDRRSTSPAFVEGTPVRCPLRSVASGLTAPHRGLHRCSRLPRAR